MINVTMAVFHLIFAFLLLQYEIDGITLIASTEFIAVAMLLFYNEFIKRVKYG